MLILERNSLQICPAFFQTRYLEGEVESAQTKKLGHKEHHKDVKSRWDCGLDTPYSLATLQFALTVETICSIEHLSPDTVSLIIFRPIDGLTRLHKSFLLSGVYSEAFGLL